MTYTGWQVFNIVQTLLDSDSKAGQARQFIRISSKRFYPAYKEAVGWALDYEDDYPEMTVKKSGDGGVEWFHFDTEKSTAGNEAFVKYLNETTYDVEPYPVTEDVLSLIDGIGLRQEAILRQITAEGIQELSKDKEDEVPD